ncbi:MAG TPA: haloacid dehalogenase [Actinomycetota bacterium]|nr:haloacid dehalogenase [Actinomycetota bacterium]
MELTKLSEVIRADLDAKTSARDVALSAGRSAIRSCGNAIRAMHRLELDTASTLLREAEGHLEAATDTLRGHDDILHAGFIHDAQKELAEAHITFALVTSAPMPDPSAIEVPPSAFLKGMAESIGELRRHILDLMRGGELERCEELLGSMDDMYYVLVSMDYPDGITHGLRRLTDVARSIIERTRGDFSIAKIQSALRDALVATDRHDATEG